MNQTSADSGDHVQASMFNGAEWYYTADDETGLADVLCDTESSSFPVAVGIPIGEARQMVAEQRERNATRGFRPADRSSES